MAEIAADGRARRIWPRKTSAINRVVTQEKTCITEVNVHLHYVAKGSSICFKNCGDIIDGLLCLLLNAVADQFSGSRVDGTRSGYENEIPCAPSLGVSPSRWCTLLALNYVFGHLLFSSRLLRRAISRRAHTPIRHYDPRSFGSQRTITPGCWRSGNDRGPCRRRKLWATLACNN